MQLSARNDPLPTNNCDYAEAPISERSGWKQKDIISFISIDLSFKKGVEGGEHVTYHREMHFSVNTRPITEEDAVS